MCITVATTRSILEKDFAPSEVQRDELAFYEPLVQRGSFRLHEGLFRTESEQRDFIREGKTITLSRPLSRSGNIIVRFLAALRRLFSRDANT
jgi:hypothetical protein